MSDDRKSKKRPLDLNTLDEDNLVAIGGHKMVYVLDDDRVVALERSLMSKEKVKDYRRRFAALKTAMDRLRHDMPDAKVMFPARVVTSRAQGTEKWHVPPDHYRVALIMRNCVQRDTWTDLSAYEGTDYDDVLRQLIMHLLPTVRALHAHDVYGLDIKPENILYCGHDWVLGDLDGALTGAFDRASWTRQLTPGFFITRAATTKQDAMRADVYAFLKTLWEVSQGHVAPQRTRALDDVLRRMREGQDADNLEAWCRAWLRPPGWCTVQ